MNKALGFYVIFLFFISDLHAANNAGKTIVARGSVQAEIDNNTRNLKRRSPIFTEDLVKTGTSSATQLRMIDGGLLSIQPESQLAINQYQFNESTKDGSVSMSLLKGGLRTVTGALNKASNNYKMETPVASIGVRGTHYEAELLNDDLYLATWEGIIDIDVLAGTDKQQFSLGPTLEYKFAVVRADGSVEYLLDIPAVFSDGYSNNLINDLPLVVNALKVKFDENNSLADDDSYYITSIDNKGSQTFFGNELQTSTLAIDAGIDRNGEVLFSELEEYSVVSSNGEVSNLAMSMNINFNTARVSEGQISFTDNTGDWFAAMDGIVEQGVLDLNVNFASHNNNLANGEINGYLINEGFGIFGNFKLFEILQPDINAGGTFILNSER